MDRQPISRRTLHALRALRALAPRIVGKVSWEPPAWPRPVGRWLLARGRTIRRHPLHALAIATLALSLVFGAVKLHRWYQSRPRPVTTAVSLTAPALTRIEKELRPHPLVLSFARSAAPLSQIGKEIRTGVTLSPALEGTWRWDSDRRLLFQPARDWPVGREVRVTLAREGLLADNVLLESYRLQFSTAPFAAALDSLRFYQDPTDPSVKKVVATLSFSHPVEPPTLERGLRMELLDADGRRQRQRVTVSYDALKAHAFVHSAPLAIPKKDQTMELTVEPGVRARRGGEPTRAPIRGQVRVPGRYSHLRVPEMRLSVAENERFELSQVLVVRTSLAVKPEQIAGHLSAHLLPRHHPDERKPRPTERYSWNDPTIIGAQILKRSRRLRLEPVPSDDPAGTLHTFRFRAPVGRYLYIRTTKGLTSFGGFELGETADTTARVPEYPKLVKLVHQGAILALGGEHKVAVYARDVPGLRFEIGRVLPEQVHHLVSQSRGTFARPEFWYGLGPDHLTELFTETRAIVAGTPGKGRYEALDLSGYLDGKDGRRHGLFLLKVQAWDPERRRADGPEDRRLVLVTDLGLVVKDEASGNHVAFVQSLGRGQPVAGARVEVLGQNGLAVTAATTDAGGMARLPPVDRLKRASTPTLYVVRHGRDMAFLPYGRHGRYLDLSRFDVGGVSDSEMLDGLSAFLFSDRGLYRPGDEIRVGMIVKDRGWERRSLAGLPLELTVTDPRGLVVRREKIRLGPSGVEELRHTTSEDALTGRYRIGLYVVKDGRGGGLLGSASVQVREFLPDRMKIRAALSRASKGGWLTPEDLRVDVTLENLFGTAAAGRRVRGTLHLSPADPAFARFPEHRFHDWLDTRQTFEDQLPDATTDARGRASFVLGLKRFAAGTYQLRFVAEGFESDGGRSVFAETWGVVSPLPYLVGYKADGALRYINRGSERAVHLVAVGPDGAARKVDGLKLVLVERRYVSVLVRQPDGTYRYESKLKEHELSRRDLRLSVKGRRLALDTRRPGDYVLRVEGEKGARLCRVSYTVAGQANVARSLERNAELQLSLARTDATPGELLQLQIRAPFTGAGLITVERERVYAHRWFRTNTTSSVQTIRVPEGLEGNGYVTVTFLRDPASPEVLISPLSYGVAPFTVSRAQRTARITLDLPERGRPGEPYVIRYRTDRPAKLVLFAVDEGILRVARYQRPRPLEHFLAKRALQVRTAQILDLLLPELHLGAAPGGGDGGEMDEATSPSRSTLGANLNPFKRRRDPPVAYWSGVVESGPEERRLTYRVPDHFNGTLRVMAVAVTPQAVGAVERQGLVRGDFVISPNLPLFAVPGDRFTVSVPVANTLEGSPARARVRLTLKTSEQLKLLGPSSATLSIPRLGEATARFRLEALARLGPASLTFVARGPKGAASRRTVGLGVRPAGPFLTTVQVGQLNAGESARVPVRRRLFAEHRTQLAGVSPLPLALAPGLIRYLERFPHGCTEQVVSQAMPAMVLNRRPELGLAGERGAQSVARVLDLLQTRQNAEGAFGLWAANSHVSPFATVYALHFLVEARERGFDLPPDLLERGLGWLKQLTTDEGEDLAGERLRAYALYVLARADQVVGRRAAELHKRLERRHARTWQRDLAAVYLAATYRLLKQDRLAERLIDRAAFGATRGPDYGHLYDGLIHDAQLLYILARHFPVRARRVSQAGIASLARAIRHGRYNTLSSAYTLLALEAYSRRASVGRYIAAEELAGGKRALPLPEGQLLPQVAFSPEARALSFRADGAHGGFYSVVQAGFDRRPPTKPIKKRLEVFREYADARGKPLSGPVRLGQVIQARVRLRALGDRSHGQLAVVDLLPAGFELLEERPAGSSWTPEHEDPREDRLVLYGGVDPTAREYRYLLKATTAGRFTVPPIKAESLYDREVVAQSAAGTIEVVE